jgi:phage shock protein A
MITRYKLYRDDKVDCCCEVDEHPEGRYTDYEEIARLLADKGLLEARLEKAYADIQKWKYATSDDYRIELKRLEEKVASLQARIASLMLEYCPDEMTKDQKEMYL